MRQSGRIAKQSMMLAAVSAALVTGLGGCAETASETEQTEYLSEEVSSEPSELTTEAETEVFIGESVEEFVGDWRDQAETVETEQQETEPETETVKPVLSLRAQQFLADIGERFGHEGYREDIGYRLNPWLFFVREDMRSFEEEGLLPEGSGLHLLKTQLTDQIDGYDGKWSVYIKDLTHDQTVLLHDEPMRSASVMKLFILGSVYRAIDEGELERTSELIELMSSMIRASSNTAANELVKRLGGGNFLVGLSEVNRYIQDEGYSSSTHMYNGFEDESLHPHPDHDNSTCVADVGQLLERIYHRTFGRRAVCNEVEEWLLGQGTRYKIPKALPGDVLCGNKTGETDTVENDCALIYTAEGDYILCVMSSDWKVKSLAQERIGQISAAVYEYFQDPEGYVEDLLR